MASGEQSRNDGSNERTPRPKSFLLPPLFKLYAQAALIAAVYAGALLFVPMLWSATTLSIEAQSEVFRFDVSPFTENDARPAAAAIDDERFDVLLPAGAYSALGTSTSSVCAHAATLDDLFHVCRYDRPTTLRVRRAELRFTLLDAHTGAAIDDTTGAPPAPPRLLVRAMPHSGRDGATVQVWSSDVGHPELLLETHDWVEFESDPITYWRAPLRIGNATLGESLFDLAAQQPILTSGSARFFSRNRLWDWNRSLVYSERFDRADAVILESGEPLVGLVSFESAPGGAAARPSAFDLVLHGNRSNVEVQRLGASHTVRASAWTRLHPAWAAFWTVFSTLTALVGHLKGGLLRKASV
jgi:hypothetical protein